MQQHVLEEVLNDMVECPHVFILIVRGNANFIW